MVFVGIDAGKKHWVCMLDHQRRPLQEPFSIQNTRQDYERLAKRIGRTAKICIEDTGSYSAPLYEYFKQRGYDIIMIKGLRAKRLREYLRDSLKTDRVDSEVLALVRFLQNDLPATDIITSTSKNTIKPLIRLYVAHVKRRAELRQQIHAIIQRRYPELADEFTNPACPTVLTILRWTTPEDWNDDRRVLQLIAAHNIRKFDKAARRALACLRGTVGVPTSNASLHILIDSYLVELSLIDQLTSQLGRELLHSPYGTLMQLPHVGLVTAAVVISAVNDVSRFPTAKKFVKYCGFRFTRDQSGSKDTERFKFVATSVRWVLSSVALNAIQFDPHLKAFAERLRKRGKPPLVVRFAVARKLLVRLYFEMRKRHHYTLQDNLRAFQTGKCPPEILQAISAAVAASGTSQSSPDTAPRPPATSASQSPSR